MMAPEGSIVERLPEVNSDNSDEFLERDAVIEALKMRIDALTESGKELAIHARVYGPHRLSPQWLHSDKCWKCRVINQHESAVSAARQEVDKLYPNENQADETSTDE